MVEGFQTVQLRREVRDEVREFACILTGQERKRVSLSEAVSRAIAAYWELQSRKDSVHEPEPAH